MGDELLIHQLWVHFSKNLHQLRNNITRHAGISSIEKAAKEATKLHHTTQHATPIMDQGTILQYELMED
jgi:hypothetical protein